MSGKRSESFVCGICEAPLQPLDPSTKYHSQAVAQLEAWDLRPTPALLALVSHVMYVHDDVVDPPGFD